MKLKKFTLVALMLGLTVLSSTAVNAQSGPVRTAPGVVSDDFSAVEQMEPQINGRTEGASEQAAAVNTRATALNLAFDNLWQDLARLVPTNCADSNKITWNGNSWGCAKDLLGCPAQGLSISGGSYSCGTSYGSATQAYQTEQLQCETAPCVGGSETCPRTCYSDCNPKQTCTADAFGVVVCRTTYDSCPYDCSYSICRERHYVTCRGSFKCEQDSWQSDNHSCTVTNVEIARCN